jgi:hypothetical protein
MRCPPQQARDVYGRSLTFAAWESVTVHHLQFETTVAMVIGFVLVLGVALIGLLQVASL